MHRDEHRKKQKLVAHLRSRQTNWENAPSDCPLRRIRKHSEDESKCEFERALVQEETLPRAAHGRLCEVGMQKASHMQHAVGVSNDKTVHRGANEPHEATNE